MVQSAMYQKCGNKSWSLLFKIIRYIFPKTSQTAQNL